MGGQGGGGESTHDSDFLSVYLYICGCIVFFEILYPIVATQCLGLVHLPRRSLPVQHAQHAQRNHLPPEKNVLARRHPMSKTKDFSILTVGE